MIRRDRVAGRDVSELLRTLTVVGFALMAGLVILFATRRGPGVSPDSASYLAGGINLAGGRGLRTFTGDVLTLFPPGLSVVAAMGVKLGLGAQQAVRLVNATAFAATVVLAYLLLRRQLRSTRLSVAATALISVSLPLLLVADRAWTEMLFIAISLTLLFVLDRFRDARRPVLWLILAAVLVWLCFLLRYIGIVAAPIGAITIATTMWRRGARAAITWAGAFTFVACAVPIAWMVRNHEVDGTLLGSRFASEDGVVVTFKRLMVTLGKWVLPDPTPAILQRGAVVVVVVTIVFISIRRARRGTFSVREPARLVPIVTFVVVYSGALAASQLTTSIDPLNNRLLLPLYVPLVVLSAITIEAVALGTRDVAGHRVRAAVVVSLVLLVLGQAAAFGDHARLAARDGMGYQTRAWRRSPLAHAVDALPATAFVASNRPDALWAVTRREPVEVSPSKPHQRSLLVETYGLRAFERAVLCARSAYLVWFEDSRGFLMPPRTIQQKLDLVVVDRYRDGTLYELPDAEGDQRRCSGGALNS